MLSFYLETVIARIGQGLNDGCLHDDDSGWMFRVVRSKKMLKFLIIALILAALGVAASPFYNFATVIANLGAVDASNIAIELPPGFAIKNGFGRAFIKGFQKCTEQSGAMSDLLSGIPIEGQKSCVVIDNEAEHIQVEVHTLQNGAYGNTVETWRVVHGNERMSVMRPNGEFVVPFQR